MVTKPKIVVTSPKTTDHQDSKMTNKAMKIWTRLTRSDKTSSYTRMKDGTYEQKNKTKEVNKNVLKGKENKIPVTNSGMQEKKPKRKGWKRFRHVALVTCRYIGMGMSHMGAAGAAYPPPADYNIDPKNWNKTFSPSYNRSRAQTPHWTANMMLFSGW